MTEYALSAGHYIARQQAVASSEIPVVRDNLSRTGNVLYSAWGHIGRDRTMGKVRTLTNGDPDPLADVRGVVRDISAERNREMIAYFDGINDEHKRRDAENQQEIRALKDQVGGLEARIVLNEAAVAAAYRAGRAPAPFSAAELMEDLKRACAGETLEDRRIEAPIGGGTTGYVKRGADPITVVRGLVHPKQ
jgi:hypothetical protein